LSSGFVVGVCRAFEADSRNCTPFFRVLTGAEVVLFTGHVSISHRPYIIFEFLSLTRYTLFVEIINLPGTSASSANKVWIIDSIFLLKITRTEIIAFGNFLQCPPYNPRCRVTWVFRIRDTTVSIATLRTAYGYIR